MLLCYGLARSTKNLHILLPSHTRRMERYICEKQHCMSANSINFSTHIHIQNKQITNYWMGEGAKGEEIYVLILVHRENRFSPGRYTFTLTVGFLGGGGGQCGQKTQIPTGRLQTLRSYNVVERRWQSFRLCGRFFEHPLMWKSKICLQGFSFKRIARKNESNSKPIIL